MATNLNNLPAAQLKLLALLLQAEHAFIHGIESGPGRSFRPGVSRVLPELAQLGLVRTLSSTIGGTVLTQAGRRVLLVEPEARAHEERLTSRLKEKIDHDRHIFDVVPEDHCLSTVVREISPAIRSAEA